MPFSQKIKSLILFGLYCFVLTWWVSEHCFFWDTLQLASKQAHWFYDHKFSYFLLPEDIDSGHPPFFGMYLALCWFLFGKTLIVSHFSVLPFLLGIVWLLYELGIYLGDKTKAKYLVILVLIDPFFMGQSILVSPDLVLVFGFLLSLLGILKERIFYIFFGNLILAIISMRGMMICFALYIWWVFIHFFNNKSGKTVLPFLIKILFQKLPPFLPAGLLALAFLGYHYSETGWVGYHADSPWAGSFERVDFMGFIKNIGILIWRFLDYGRFVLWGVLGYLIFQIPTIKQAKWRLNLFALTFILMLFLLPSLLLHKGLLNHRYLLPITISLSLFFYHLIVQLALSLRQQRWVYGLAFFGLLIGNFWIYPKKVAQGWDATLAHAPYYSLRGEMMKYIDSQNINPNEVGTVFPNIGPLEMIDLNGQLTGFVKKDFKTNKYIFYSTVFNDFTDEELDILENDWTIVQRYESFGIEVVLYGR